MRPSSSRSEPGEPATAGGLFGPSFTSPAVERALSDAALLRAMLAAEAALARASCQAGRAPAEAAEAIARVCAEAEFDLDELGRQAANVANPVEPLTRALASRLPPDAARHVHAGATSQDILDTATSLLAKRASELILADLRALADACAAHVEAGRRALLPARTLLQQALPTTFGVKAAGWLTAVDAAATRLATARADLAAQLGGAAGTLAAFDADGPRIAADYAARLGLAEPILPWHTERTRVASLAAAAGVAAGTLGKIALDVKLLAQSEVDEVREGGSGRGGSSTMPHKHNPVDAVLLAAGTARAPGLVATVLSLMPQEHERAAGGWQAEWQATRELLSLLGGAAARAARLVGGLQVRAERMRANLDATGGLLLAENVSRALAASLGKSGAHQALARAAADSQRRGVPLREALRADEQTSALLTDDQLDVLLDPAGYLGAADQLCDRAIAAHQRTWATLPAEVGQRRSAAGQSDHTTPESTG